MFITTTNVLETLNKVKNNTVVPKEIEANLKELKKEAKEEKTLMEKEDFDIFGSIVEDRTKIKEIANKKHRELPKDKFNILEINKNTKTIGYQMTLQKIVENIDKALQKIEIQEDIPVYKAQLEEKLDAQNINIFNINPEEEIKEIIKSDKNKIYLYKINLKQGTKAISYTNSIFYDNQNKTLPLGQDLSTKILIDVSKLQLNLENKKSFKIVEFEDEKDDFSKTNVKTIHVFEYIMIETK